MQEKVSITITTDKPVKITVTPEGGDNKEQAGLKRLLDEVKGGTNHVAKKE